MARPAKTAEAPETKAPATRSVLKIKGQRTEWHHLFKSDVQPMSKNVSFKKGVPRIEKLDHTHLFHTVNSQLKPQQYTSTVGGHFHEVEWVMTADGPKVTKVGPPIGYRYVSKPGGQKRKLGAVQWRDENQEKDIVDNHTHVFTYVHSEELSEKNIRAVSVEHVPLEQQMASAGLEELG